LRKRGGRGRPKEEGGPARSPVPLPAKEKKGKKKGGGPWCEFLDKSRGGKGDKNPKKKRTIDSSVYVFGRLWREKKRGGEKTNS